MVEWSLLLKGLAWFIGVCFLPLAGWLGGKYLKAQDDRFKEQDNELMALKNKSQELSERMVRLEANSVSRIELLDLLRKLEDSIEERFDRSFNRLEATLNKIIEKIH